MRFVVLFVSVLLQSVEPLHEEAAQIFGAITRGEYCVNGSRGLTSCRRMIDRVNCEWTSETLFCVGKWLFLTNVLRLWTELFLELDLFIRSIRIEVNDFWVILAWCTVTFPGPRGKELLICSRDLHSVGSHSDGDSDVEFMVSGPWSSFKLKLLTQQFSLLPSDVPWSSISVVQTHYYTVNIMLEYSIRYNIL